MNIKMARWSSERRSSTVAAFLKRPAIDASAEIIARNVLSEIKADGDAAVVKYAKRFDDASLSPSQFRVRPAELKAAREQVDAEFIAAARESHRRIMAFARVGLRKDWTMSSPKGGMIGEQFMPLNRVGIYIPGGTAPLVSTALMTATLARVAGVPEIVACSPVGPSLQMHPYLLFVMELAGVTEIYKIGGIQAIGAMAYGTVTIPKVRKIVGPGGPYVTAAKCGVYGDVSLDLVAGPSEVAVLADDSAAPNMVAADLLSQAEHGTGYEKCLLVTTSSRLAEQVRTDLIRQMKTLSRRDAIVRVLAEGTLIVVVNHLDDGMKLCNLFAPEHLEIIVRQPRVWLKKAQHAGAIFVGPCTPECVGDFAAGPSHVLPTGGTAAMFSGLTADDFRKRSSIIAYTRADLKDALHIVKAFGRVEGLDAHARAASMRFDS